MIQKRTISDFFTQVMAIWGIAMLSMCFFCALFGEIGKGESTLYELGNKGIPIASAIQLLFLAIIIVLFEWTFFTDLIIKKLSIMVRSILMFICIIIAIAIFAAVFGWFPINKVKPWVMFILCFFIYSSVSVILSVLKEKSDNKKMQKALQRMKGEDS